MSENIVKQTAKDLGLTQKELADAIGAAEATVRNWSAGKEIPEWAMKSMNMLIEARKDKEIIDTLKKLQNLISER